MFLKQQFSAAARAALAPVLGGLAVLALGVAAQPAPVAAADPVTAVIFEFSNNDTSGEDSDRTARHAARVSSFDELLADSIAARGTVRFVGVDCPQAPCEAGRMPVDEVFRMAQQAGARLLVHGGIHKMSTLVQFGALEVIDIESQKVVLKRTFSFRGDTDEAFRRAADFMARYFDEVTRNL